MSFVNFQKSLSGFTLDDYLLLDTRSKQASPSLTSSPSLERSTSSSTDTPTAWAGLRLNPRLVQSLAQHSPRWPQPLHKRIVSAILAAHHLELYIPPGSGSTTAVGAGLLSVALEPSPITTGSSVGATRPIVLIVSLSPQRAARTTSLLARLAHGIPAARPSAFYDETTLSVDLDRLRAGVDKDARVVTTTLGRVSVLLDHQALSLDQLAILTLDLRSASASPPINHHTLAELSSLLGRLHPLTQIVVLFSTGMSPSSSLASLLSRAMDRSIRINLGGSAPPSSVAYTPQCSSSEERVTGTESSTSFSKIQSPNLTGLGIQFERSGQLARQCHWAETIDRFERAGLSPSDFEAGRTYITGRGDGIPNHQSD